MNVQTTKVLGSILFEFADDGSGLQHVIRTDKTFVRDTETGKLLIAPKLEAVALDPGDLAALVGEQFAAVAEQVTALTAERAAALADKTAAETERDAAVAVKAGLEARVAALSAQLHPVDEDGFAVLTPVQLRLALIGAGITTQMVMSVIAAIADPIERERAMTYWDYTLEYHRDHALIAQFATALGLPSDQVDQMWQAAASIQ